MSIRFFLLKSFGPSTDINKRWCRCSVFSLCLYTEVYSTAQS